MGGGYIACGDWEGSDKSAKRIYSTFDALKRYAPASLLPRIEALSEKARAPYLQPDFTYRIEPDLAAALIQPLEALLMREGIWESNGLVWLEADSGAAIYGPSDLLAACKVSRETGQPVEIDYD